MAESSVETNGAGIESGCASSASSGQRVRLPNRHGLVRLHRSCAILIILIVYGQNLWAGWHCWGDVIIDTGRELDTPRQILGGKTLYRDVRYWYGPLAPYLNALLYRAFGVHADVLSVAGWVTAALAAGLAYRTVRLFAGRSVAVAGAVAILYMNAFAFYYGCNIFNFVLPYSCPATYGTVLGLASIFCLLRYVRKQGNRDFFLACVLLSLTSLCKLEIFCAVAVTHLVFVIAALATGRLKAVQCAAGYILTAVIPVSVYSWFYAQTGPSLWSDNLLLRNNFSTNWFTISREGFKNIGFYLRGAMQSAHGLAGCLAVMWVVARVDRWRRLANPTNKWINQSRVAVAGVLGGMLCAIVYIRLGPFLALRILPILLIAMMIVHAFRFLRRPRESHASGDLAAALLYTFALAMLARIWLRAGADYYGFYMALPGVLTFTIFWCRIAPELVASPGGVGSNAARVCGFALMAGLVWTHFERTSLIFDERYGAPRTSPIRTKAGILPCPSMYVGTVDQAIDYLSKLPPETKVVVVPEGAAITFLAGCTNALGMHTFLPVDFSGDYSDARMVERFERADPDLIVRTSRDVREYGKEGLGIDYGLKLEAWIGSHYEEIQRFRAPAYQVTILGRRPVSTRPVSTK